MQICEMCGWFRRISFGLLFVLIATNCGRMPAKLSLVEWSNYRYYEPSGPGTYAFGYDVEDPATSNVQYREEERHPNGTVTGSYGYGAPDGSIQIVHYVADENGYRASIEDSRSLLSMLSPMSAPMRAALENLDTLGQKLMEERTRPADQVLTERRNSRNGAVFPAHDPERIYIKQN